MAKDTIDIILASIQIFTLIALIVYVWKTWDMAVSTKRAAEVSENTLNEMKNARDQEVAPYVVAYFEIIYPLINLVVKNMGKSIAKDVKIEFNPKLINSMGHEISEYSLIKKGIGSIPPGHKVKTFLDSAYSYFNDKDLPLEYKVKINYKGGIKKEYRFTEQVLDLSTFKELRFINERGLSELVKEINDLNSHNKKISYNLEKISDRLDNGVWIKNPEFLITNLQTNNSWKDTTISTLLQFKMLWASIDINNRNTLINPFLTDLQNMITLVGTEILLISSKCSFNVSNDIISDLNEISSKLLDLGKFRFGLGSKSIESFNNTGNEIIELINDIIEKMETVNVESEIKNLKSKI